MSCETMQENLTRRLAGDLPAAEAAELDRHLAGCADCRAAADELAQVWNGLGELPEESPSPLLKARFDSMLAAEIAAHEPATTPLAFRGRSAANAAPETAALRGSIGSVGAGSWLKLAAMLAFGFGLGWLFWGRGKSDVVALREEVGQLHQMVAQSLLEKSSVSERLQGVAYSREFSAGEPGVADALVQALVSDPNVNVRLAALEALKPIANRDSFRPRLLAVALQPESPLVSLSVIDVLLESGTPAARHDLEQLLNDPKLEPVVRGYLRDRLGRRI